MEVLAQKLHEHESKDSRFVELIYHLVYYYKFDIKFLQEYKTVFTEPKLSDEISNFVQMKEQDLFLGPTKFQGLDKEIKKRVIQLYEEDWFRYSNENYFDNSKSLEIKS